MPHSLSLIKLNEAEAMWQLWTALDGEGAFSRQVGSEANLRAIHLLFKHFTRLLIKFFSSPLLDQSLLINTICIGHQIPAAINWAARLLKHLLSSLTSKDKDNLILLWREILLLLEEKYPKYYFTFNLCNLESDSDQLSFAVCKPIDFCSDKAFIAGKRCSLIMSFNWI